MISIFYILRNLKEISIENSSQNLHKNNLRFSWKFSMENSKQNLRKYDLRFSWEISIENSSEFLFGDLNENVKRFLVENSLRDRHRRIWHGMFLIFVVDKITVIVPGSFLRHLEEIEKIRLLSRYYARFINNEI